MGGAKIDWEHTVDWAVLSLDDHLSVTIQLDPATIHTLTFSRKINFHVVCKLVCIKTAKVYR